MTIEYRPYQAELRDAVFREFTSRVDSTLLVAATGTGKTTIAGMVIQQALEEHGRPALFLAHREELVNQAARRFDAFGLETAIEMAGQDARRDEAMFGRSHVVVGSVQSMQGGRLIGWDRERFGLIVVDEAHHALAASYATVFNWFRDCWLLGITATPARGDARNLGSVFRSKAAEYSMRAAIKDGWLVPVATQTCTVQVDLRDIRTTGGDFNVGDLAERVGPKLEELARALVAEAGGRQTVVFCPDVGSSLGMAKVLGLLGKSARYVAGTGGDYGMPKSERRSILESYRRDEFQFLVNCDLLFEGWDCPQVKCVCVCRPTKQSHRYTQMAGRGVRPCEASGFGDCLIVDFDWQTDESSKDLCVSVELFDDSSFDPDVLPVARERMKAGQPDPMKAVEEAEEIVRVRKTLDIRLTGREAEYRAIRSDPLGVAKLVGVALKKRYDMDAKGTNPASDGQIKYLKALGVRNPDGISKWGAAKMIDRLKKRREQGLASPYQVQQLLSGGVGEDYARSCTAEKAAEAIRQIEASRPESQGSLF